MKKSEGLRIYPCVFFAVCWIAIELFFRELALFGFGDVSLLQSMLFSMANVGILLSILCILPKKIHMFIMGLLLTILAMYAFVQLSYHRYMNAYFSWSLFFSMFSRIEDYSGDFLHSFTFLNALVFIPVILFALSQAVARPTQALIARWKWMLATFVAAFGLNMLSMMAIQTMQKPKLPLPLIELYHNPYLIDLSMEQFGLGRFFYRDLTKALLGIESPQPTILVIQHETPISTPPDLSRSMDDAAWIKLMEAETNPTLKSIDAYLMNRTLTPKNTFTGLFKGKNLIYIMVEAFDFMAIDETLTPTLYDMTQKGFYFDHFFSPQYSCATGESEFIGLTSLIPRMGICSPNTYTSHAFPTSLFNLFNRAGYFSSSYHSYTDKFYERTLLHKQLGSAKFYNADDLDIPVLKGWPSDVDLMKEAFDEFKQEERFFSFIITASTHFPYDVDSTLGNRYLDEVNAVISDLPMKVQRYKSKAIELDHALKTLLDLLTQQGLLKDTVLILFGDHFPLKTERELLLDYGDPNNDRNVGYNINTLPMIIYHADTPGTRISKVGSNFDLVPTIANLFDLDYDPRYYFGTDLFSDVQDPIVPYPSLSWNTQKGTFSAAKGSFTPFDDKDSLSDEDVESLRLKVVQEADVSYTLLRNDYFRYRLALFENETTSNQSP